MATQPNPHQLAAIWLCYVTNVWYKQKLNRPLEDVLADQNFLDVTEITPEQLTLIHPRIYQQEEVEGRIETARGVFRDVFALGTVNSLWDDSSPKTDVIASLASSAPPEE